MLRDAAVHEPHYSLKDLAHLDGRVEAHIDGLYIVGSGGWEICRETLALEEPGEVFVAAVLAFESEDGMRVDEVVQAGMKTAETWRALVSAMGWLSDSNFQHWAVAANVIRRHDPGTALAKMLEDSEPFYQARALRAAGELKRHDLLPALRQRFAVNDHGCRFWAAWSALLLGDQSALAVLKRFVQLDFAYREQALRLALRVMDGEAAQFWLKELAKQPELLRDVLTGAGVIGDPVYIPALIKQMENAEVARVAGEAFAMITGVDLAYDDLEGEWPESFEAGPSENADDDNVDMDTDEDLPRPEPVLVQNAGMKIGTDSRLEGVILPVIRLPNPTVRQC